MKASLKHVRPLLSEADGPSIGRVVIGTVQGDLHDIGKNLVGMMLEGAGFKVVDLGVNTDAPEIIEAAKKLNADVIGLSALLTTTMPFMKKIIGEIKKQGMKTPVIIGGAPVSQEFADMANADGYGKNAPEAVTLCNQLCDAPA